jgi:uncharacterized membrane protein
MEGLPLHPKVVHLPIALSVILPLLTAGVLLAWWRGWFARRVWIVVVALQALLVGSGFFAMNAGEAEEETVEAVVPESAIHAHEEAAETFVWAAVGVLVIAFAGAAIPKERAALVTAAATFLGTLIVLYLGFQTGDAGGRLVYEYDAPAAYSSPAGGTEGDAPAVRSLEREGEHEHDDD